MHTLPITIHPYSFWTVREEPLLPRKKNAVTVQCRCGIVRNVLKQDLKRGHSMTCGSRSCRSQFYSEHPGVNTQKPQKRAPGRRIYKQKPLVLPPGCFWTVLTNSTLPKKVGHVPCRCRCGLERNLRRTNLRAGGTMTCGRSACREAFLAEQNGTAHVAPSVTPRVQNQGKRPTVPPPGSFWTVLENSTLPKRKDYVACRCRCGIERNVPRANMIQGFSMTCGSIACRRAYVDQQAALGDKAWWPDRSSKQGKAQAQPSPSVAPTPTPGPVALSSFVAPVRNELPSDAQEDHLLARVRSVFGSARAAINTRCEAITAVLQQYAQKATADALANVEARITATAPPPNTSAEPALELWELVNDLPEVRELNKPVAAQAERFRFPKYPRVFVASLKAQIAIISEGAIPDDAKAILNNEVKWFAPFLVWKGELTTIDERIGAVLIFDASTVGPKAETVATAATNSGIPCLITEEKLTVETLAGVLAQLEMSEQLKVF